MERREKKMNRARTLAKKNKPISTKRNGSPEKIYFR